MSWRSAFLKQAFSDYTVFRSLNKSQFPLCHRLHYLQMAVEKLAKSYLCSRDDEPPVRTHAAIVRFLQISKRRPGLRRSLGIGDNHAVYRAYIDSLMNVAACIENLAPAGGNIERENPEYPWRDARGVVICPAEHSFSSLTQTDLARFQKLISDLFAVAATN